MAESRGWLTPGDAARLLGVDQRTVRRQADRGRFRVIRTLGGHRRLHGGDVEAAATEQPTRRPPAPPRSGAVPHESTATDAERASLAAWTDRDTSWLTTAQAAESSGCRSRT